jgi:hypothetical protein
MCKYLFFILPFLIGCYGKSKPNNNSKTSAQIINKVGLKIPNNNCLENEGGWEYNFKNLVCFNILQNLYGADFEKHCLNKDASLNNAKEWLDWDSTTIANAKIVSDKFLKDPSLKGTIEGNKVILSFVISIRLSHELDSITGSYYHKYQKDSANSVK